MKRFLFLPRRFAFLLLGFCAGVSLSFGQTSFQRTYGGSYNDEGRSVQQTSDGGYIIAGSFGAGLTDVYLVKTNSFGDTLWTRRYGSANYDEGYSVQQTSDGGYVIAGYTGPSDTSSSDVYLVKTDSSGNTLWTRTYGGTHTDWGSSVQQTYDGGYIIIGTTSGANSSDVYLVKTDSLGDTLWTRAYGGTETDHGNSVEQTYDGGYIVAGSTTSFGAGMTDVYLVKTNSFGDTLWTRTYGGTENEYGNSVQQTSDSGYIITGESFGGLYLLKTNSSGDTLWTRTYSGSGNSVQKTSDGGYIIAGYIYRFGATWSDVYLVKTNSSGDTLWTRTYGGPSIDDANSVQQTSDGGYVITGLTNYDPIGNTPGDVYLIKTRVDGLVPVRNEHNVTPIGFALLQNYPNPFNPTTTISFNLPSKSFVSLRVFDALGREVSTLRATELTAGTYSQEWNAAGLASGVYFYRLQAGTFVETRKLLLLR